MSIPDGADSRHWDTWRIPGKVWTIGSVNLHTKSYKDHLNSELVRFFPGGS